MNLIICFLFCVVIMIGTESAVEMDDNEHKNDEAENDPEPRSSEQITELAEVKNKSNETKRREKSPNSEDNAHSNTTLETNETESIDSLEDFDDLEYDREAINNEDDYVDEDRVAAKLDKENKSKERDTSTSALAPIIDAAVRAGEIQSEISDSDPPHNVDNENREISRESNVRRRMFDDSASVNHEHRIAPESTQFGTVPNILHVFVNNIGPFPSPPYSSTPYPSRANGFQAPFQNFPTTPNINPYNYMLPKSEYKNPHETNNYPYIGHRKADDLPPMPYNVYGNPNQDYYKRPGLLNGFNNLYGTNNYRPLPFGHGRFV